MGFMHVGDPRSHAGSLDHTSVATYVHSIAFMQDQAAQLMDDILTPVPIDLEPM